MIACASGLTWAAKAARLTQRIGRAVQAWLLAILAAVASGGAAADQVVFFHVDTSGTPLAATDSSGAVLWQDTYRPYGQRVGTASVPDNKLWFTGKPYDDATGFSYMGDRYYDPVLGRFLSQDPAPFSEANLHSVNRYAYANNNPQRFVDLDGREAVGAAWTERTNRFFERMPKPRNKLEASLELAGVALPFVLVGGFVAVDLTATALANPATTVMITESVLAGESLGGGTLVAAGATTTVVKAAEEVAWSAAQAARSAALAAKVSRQLTSEQIASGHAFIKHVIKQGQFPDIRTRAEFASVIAHVMENASHVRQLERGRVAYWLKGVVVISDPKSADGGTAFVPDNGLDYFLGLK